jgi:hypothetical protein
MAKKDVIKDHAVGLQNNEPQVKTPVRKPPKSPILLHKVSKGEVKRLENFKTEAN